MFCVLAAAPLGSRWVGSLGLNECLWGAFYGPICRTASHTTALLMRLGVRGKGLFTKDRRKKGPVLGLANFVT